MLTMLQLAVIVALTSCAGNTSAPAARGEAPAASPQHAPAQSDAPTPRDPAIELLEQLERSAADLTGFTAGLVYQRWDPMIGRTEERAGSIVYDLRDQDDKRLAVLLDRELFGSRQRTIRKQYVFDGEWLAEIDHDAKTFTKRQIVPPGEQFDPLKLGEGPFPLPLGQAKDEVLERFEVSLATRPEEGLLKNLTNVRGLRLIPKPDAPEAEVFQSIEIFYDAESLLPVGVTTVAARAIDPADPTSRERKTVLLTSAKRNPELSQEHQSLLVIAEPDPREWQVEITPWR